MSGDRVSARHQRRLGRPALRSQAVRKWTVVAARLKLAVTVDKTAGPEFWAVCSYARRPTRFPGRDLRPAREVGQIPGKDMLKASVEAGESGPVITVSGEADLTCAEQLGALIAGQLAGGTRQLTIDMSGLRFADSASVRTLALAARTLKERGGNLVLLDPQPPVARVLALLGVDQMVSIRGKTPTMEQLETSEQEEPQIQPAPGGTRRACG